MEVIPVATGVFWVDIPERDLYILCGSPADTVKHLKKRGLIVQKIFGGVMYESGPNAILLSDVPVQKGHFSNLAEFPILHMLFKQGMGIPNHPNNHGERPILIGSAGQIKSQSEYLFRGQYGLANLAEIRKCGLKDDYSEEFFRIKKWFAFGSIKPSGEQIESVAIDSKPVEIREGLTVERVSLNVFRFTLDGHEVTVDLNLGEADAYEPAIPLDYHSVEREYFSVIHVGEGDGWDISKPCMGSILTYQGKIYLIDAGPFILNSLKALGISVNEIEGIFHTHGHDDHFAGLTSLMYTDHKIKYFASRLVRESVIKKLSSLMGVPQSSCEQAFEINDLKLGSWNNIGGLSVMPVFSPHPVETNVFWFRTPWGGGFKQYMHLADIAGRKVLDELLLTAEGSGESAKVLHKQMTDLITRPVDLKKADIGGGMIHGVAEDFAADRKSKIILSHTSEKLTFRQKEIGSSASFGMVDVLIPGAQNYFMQSAWKYLREYFPEVPAYELNLLLNTGIDHLNMGNLILRKGEKDNPVYLVLSGVVEVINTEKESSRTLTSGSFIGERSLLFDEPSRRTFRAASNIRLLAIPKAVYLGFIERNFDREMIRKLHEMTTFLQSTRLFGELLPSVTQQRIARSAREFFYAENEPIPGDDTGCIHLVYTGGVTLFMEGLPIEDLGPGDFFGEDSYFYQSAMLTARANTDTCVYKICLKNLATIPVIEWKMLESFERRLTAFGTRSQEIDK